MTTSRIYGDQQIELDSQSIYQFFEGRAEEKDKLKMTMYQPHDISSARDFHEKNVILPKLYLSNDAKVLDVGCGNGRWYDSLSNYGVNYVGVDFSPSLIAIANETYAADENCTFITLKADDVSPNLMIDSEFFSHAIVSGVMIYLSDLEITRMLKGIASCTTRGSLIYIREPVGVERRLTLNKHWSDELNSHYSAIYRTKQELIDCVCHQDENSLSIKLIDSGLMYGSILNNRSDTKQMFFIFECL